METKIIESKKNPFLEREEIVFEVKSDVTPKISDIKKTLGKDENLIDVRKINSNFGRHTFIVEIFAYDNLEAREKIEVIPKKIKKKIASEKKEKQIAEKKAAEEVKEIGEEAK
ncbi:MAG: hypothetical protein ABIF88_03380 [archaeon]